MARSPVIRFIRRWKWTLSALGLTAVIGLVIVVIWPRLWPAVAIGLAAGCAQLFRKTPG